MKAAGGPSVPHTGENVNRLSWVQLRKSCPAEKDTLFNCFIQHHTHCPSHQWGVQQLLTSHLPDWLHIQMMEFWLQLCYFFCCTSEPKRCIPICKLLKWPCLCTYIYISVSHEISHFFHSSIKKAPHSRDERVLCLLQPILNCIFRHCVTVSRSQRCITCSNFFGQIYEKC